MRVGKHEIGAGHPCFVIAEIAQAHDGSLGAAHAYIDAVARSGAQAIKFQTHIADAESTPGEPWRVKFSRQDVTRYDYWRRMEFTAEQWSGLAAHAQERGITFLSSAFSEQAVDLLSKLGMPLWKVGSGEVTNTRLLKKMAATGRPILLSSGLSTFDDLDAAVACVRAAGVEVAVLQCTTSYPCPPEKTGLNAIAELRARYECPVGLSDHSATIYAGIAAAALGADIIEVHAVFSKDCFGPDTSSSLTLAELAELTKGVGFVSQALAHPVDKSALAPELAELRKIFGKSVVATSSLNAGTVLTASHLTLKKPGTGLPPSALEGLVGRRLRRAVASNAMITEADLDAG